MKVGKNAKNRLKIQEKVANFGTMKSFKNKEISWKEELSHPWAHYTRSIKPFGVVAGGYMSTGSANNV